jgi:hypothetical protein
MAFPRVTHLAIGVALAAGSLNAPAYAQFSKNAPAGATAAEPEGAAPEGAGDAAVTNQPNQRAPWDTDESRVRALKARFTGLGGMGGFGGRGGRGGGPGGAPERPNTVTVMISLLENSKILQDEIGLTETQKEQIQTIKDTVDEKRREMFDRGRGNRGGGGGQGAPNNGGRGNRGGGGQGPAALNSGGRILGVQNPGGQNPGGQNGGRNGGQNGGNRGGFGGADFQAMRQQMEALTQESQAAILRILTQPQKTRLAQIALQIEGPLAVTRPEIASALKLKDAQIQKLQAVLAQMQATQQEAQTAQMTKMRELFRTARNAPNTAGPGGGPATAPPQNGGRGGRFTANPQMQEAMQTSMKESGELQDQLLAKTEAAINKLLTASQKKKIKSMLGEEFDVLALATENPAGGFGGFGGGPPGGGRQGGAPPAAPGGGRQGGRNAQATQ